MPKCCELYNDGLFLGPVRCALLILESGMSTPASFTDLLTSSWIFSDVSSFSHGMSVIRRQVLRLYCSLHSTKFEGIYIFPEVLHYSLSVYSHASEANWQWKKASKEKAFQFFLNNLLYFIFENLPQDFIYSIKANLNFLTFSSIAALDSSVLEVLGISK